MTEPTTMHQENYQNSDRPAGNILGAIDHTRIPPPPPLTAEYGWDGREGGNIFKQVAGFSEECLLTIRCPRKQGEMAMVQVQIYPTMRAELLGQCVSQAISQYSPGPIDQQLVGLFDERDQVFHSFQQILSLPDPSMQLYCTIRVFREEPIPKPWWTTTEFCFFVCAIVVAMAAYFHGETALDLSMIVSMKVHHTLFSLPLEELYRHGPHIIGWEGFPLTEVCNRITNYGDREFWRRNMDECERIYGSKEEAFLRIMHPIVYFSVLLVAFFIVRSLVVSYGESKRNRTDRVILEAYHAFQTLVKIANRPVGQQRR